MVGSVWDSISCVERLAWCGEERGLGMKRLIALLSVKRRRKRHKTEVWSWVCGERCSNRRRGLRCGGRRFADGNATHLV